MFKLTGITKAVFNDMGEPELLDDLTDHWTGENHADERRFLIEHLQMLAKAKKLRISIISGDVHLAATGRLYSYPKMKDLSMDFRYMPQVRGFFGGGRGGGGGGECRVSYPKMKE